MKKDVFEKLFVGLDLGSAVLLRHGRGEGKSHAIVEMAHRLPEGVSLVFVAHAPTRPR